MTTRALPSSLPAVASAPVAFASSSCPVFSRSTPACWLVAEPTPPWGALPPPSWAPSPDPRALAGPPALPPASRLEARSLRDTLAGLLSRERAAAADFLLALADFDRRRGPQALGHKSLFTFLTRELHLSNGAAYLRSSAAGLLPRFPAVEAALRDGRLCLSAVGELARVLEPENEARFLPRFFGCSAREAREVAAELAPRQDPPRREVVTRLPMAAPAATATAVDVEVTATAGSCPGFDSGPGSGSGGVLPLHQGAVDGRRVESLRAHEVGITHPARAISLTPEVEPLTSDLRRLHLTVSKRLLTKLARAKDGLAHALPGASTEQVLEAALDLLLEKQDRRKGLVKRPRTVGQKARPVVAPISAPTAEAAATSAAGPAGTPTAATTTRRPSSPAAAPPTRSPSAPSSAPTATSSGWPTSPSRSIPAAVRREVWLRDGHRCQHPLDSGGTCGATARLELDHVIPLALGGPNTADNLRVTCQFHNQAAASEVLGAALVEDQRSRARQGWSRAGRVEPFTRGDE